MSSSFTAKLAQEKQADFQLFRLAKLFPHVNEWERVSASADASLIFMSVPPQSGNEWIDLLFSDHISLRPNQKTKKKKLGTPNSAVFTRAEGHSRSVYYSLFITYLLRVSKGRAPFQAAPNGTRTVRGRPECICPLFRHLSKDYIRKGLTRGMGLHMFVIVRITT